MGPRLLGQSHMGKTVSILKYSLENSSSSQDVTIVHMAEYSAFHDLMSTYIFSLISPHT